jgi:hypothetical protein
MYDFGKCEEDEGQLENPLICYRAILMTAFMAYTALIGQRIQ